MSKESSLVTACLILLQGYENQGRIAWFDRFNSGTIFTSKPFPRKIKLHRGGTPDIMVITNSGFVFWIECKRGSKQSEEQVVFQKMISRFMAHRYIIIEQVDELEELISTVSC